MNEIARLGLSSSVDRSFYPREAAQAITSRICDPLTVDGEILRAELEEDIAYRCDIVADTLDGLRRDGLDDHQLLAKYQKLDSILELLENAVDLMLWQWDRRIWAEENRMRGK